MPIILALGSLRWENLTFEDSLGLYSEVLENGDEMLQGGTILCE